MAVFFKKKEWTFGYRIDDLTLAQLIEDVFQGDLRMKLSN